MQVPWCLPKSPCLPILGYWAAVNDLEETATILERGWLFPHRPSSAEQKRMGYHSGNGWGPIRLLNANAMVRGYSQWETVEQVIARIAHAALLEDILLRKMTWRL